MKNLKLNTLEWILSIILAILGISFLVLLAFTDYVWVSVINILLFILILVILVMVTEIPNSTDYEE